MTRNEIKAKLIYEGVPEKYIEKRLPQTPSSDIDHVDLIIEDWAEVREIVAENPIVGMKSMSEKDIENWAEAKSK